MEIETFNSEILHFPQHYKVLCPNFQWLYFFIHCTRKWYLLVFMRSYLNIFDLMAVHLPSICCPQFEKVSLYGVTETTGGVVVERGSSGVVGMMGVVLVVLGVLVGGIVEGVDGSAKMIKIVIL